MAEPPQREIGPPPHSWEVIQATPGLTLGNFFYILDGSLVIVTTSFRAPIHPETRIMKIFTTVLAAGLLLATSSAPAQTAKSDQIVAKVTDMEIELLRKDLRDQKKNIVAANVPLTGDEAAKFWPVYEGYTQETIRLNDQRYALVKEYAGNFGSMTDSLAPSYIRRWIGVDEAASKLRLQWISKFEVILGEKKAAIFFQVDRRIGLMQEIQLASQLPLIQP